MNEVPEHPGVGDTTEKGEDDVGRQRTIRILKIMARHRIRLSFLHHFLLSRRLERQEIEAFMESERDMDRGIKELLIQLGFGDHILNLIRAFVEYARLAYDGKNAEDIMERVYIQVDAEIDRLEWGDLLKFHNLFDLVVEKTLDDLEKRPEEDIK